MENYFSPQISRKEKYGRKRRKMALIKSFKWNALKNVLIDAILNLGAIAFILFLLLFFLNMMA